MNTSQHYDVAIIGAGMSGLAAGIRLAHFGRRVCIFERHYAAGGLNSFYRLDGRDYDVGLHAMTNFVPPGARGTPLAKLLRQLRLAREELDLCPQRQSRIVFGTDGGRALRFTNDPAVLEAEIAAHFPRQSDGFRRLISALAPYDDAASPAAPVSAREVIRRHLTDPLLEDMLLCPLMYYGSAQERDMDFVQFSIMFRSIFLEGLARPLAGIRQIIRVLLEKYRAAGGERRMKCGVRRLVVREGRAAALVIDDGTEIRARHVLSSAGAEETDRLIDPETTPPMPRAVAGGSAATGTTGRPGRRLSFVETIRVLGRQPAELGWGDDTIVFFNDGERFEYACPGDQVDLRSGVICLPNNFEFGERRLPVGQLRITCLANHDRWTGLEENRYRADKQRWLEAMTARAAAFLPTLADGALAAATVATDMFTPPTIVRYTGHLGGAVYGSPRKIRDGRTRLSNVYLCGTDQGLLGIVGSMLSGITMANRHILQPEA